MEKEMRRIEFFDGLADVWDSMFEPPPEERLRAIALLARLKKTSHVLDVGCGTGVMVPALINELGESGKIFAVDPAERMLEKVKAKFSCKQVETRCETMEHCKLPSESLDAVVCFSCFPHISDKPRAVANASRMLKSGGSLVIAHVSGRDEINAFHRECSDAVRGDILPSDAEMTSMLRAAGLRVDRFVDGEGRYEVVAVKS